jgi:hypothetical protein
MLCIVIHLHFSINTMHRFALFLAVVACICIQSEAATTTSKYYKCSPTADDDCSDSKTATVETCEGECAYCRVVIQEVDNTVSYLRQCAVAPRLTTRPVGSEVGLAVPRSPLTLTVIESASSIPAGHLFVCP